MSLSAPSLMSPRSSGRRSSSIVRCSRASLPTSTSRLRIFRATRSAGQPTKLSATMCSPVDVEIALRDVPRSIPTVNIPSDDLSAAMYRLLAPTRSTLAQVRVNPVEQGVGNRLPVARSAQQFRLVVVREAGDFGENRGHSGADQHHEGRGLDAPIPNGWVYATEVSKKRTLDRFRKTFRFVFSGVHVDLIDQCAHVGQ